MTTVLTTWVEDGFTCEIKQLSNGSFSYLIERDTEGIDGYTRTKLEASEKIKDFLKEYEHE